MPAEVILSTIAGSHDGERLLVVLCHNEEGASRLELRQQSFGEGIGWFNQGTIQLAPEQVGELRGALGVTSVPQTVSAPFRRRTIPSWQPRLVAADSA